MNNEQTNALKERLHRWIANAERNRIDNFEKLAFGEMSIVTYHERRNYIDGQIDAYREMLKVL